MEEEEEEFDTTKWHLDDTVRKKSFIGQPQTKQGKVVSGSRGSRSSW